MSKHLLLALALSVSVGFPSGVARAADGELDNASVEALQKTQELLRSPALRAKAGRDTPAAAAALENVESVAGSDPKLVQDIHELSADIFASLTREADGDAVKMAELLEKVQKNPDAFEKLLSAEQRAQLKEIASRTPASQKSH